MTEKGNVVSQLFLRITINILLAHVLISFQSFKLYLYRINHLIRFKYSQTVIEMLVVPIGDYTIFVHRRYITVATAVITIPITNAVTQVI